MLKLLIIIFVWLAPIQSIGQIDTSYSHNRNRAALLSAIVPGSGQIYNEIGHRKVQGRKHISWWRAPLYLSGLAVTGYYARHHGMSAAIYKKEWLFKNEFGDEKFFHSELEGYSFQELETEFEMRVKYRDYFIAGFFVVYGLNVVDAFVDAHFVSFDVSENLSLNLSPKFYDHNSFGINLSLQVN